MKIEHCDNLTIINNVFIPNQQIVCAKFLGKHYLSIIIDNPDQVKTGCASLVMIGGKLFEKESGQRKYVTAWQQTDRGTDRQTDQVITIGHQQQGVAP